MTFCKENSRITRDGHSFQFLLLIGSFWVVDIIQFADALLDARFHVQQTLMIHLPVHCRMTSSTLFHELREDTSMIGLFPLF